MIQLISELRGGSLNSTNLYDDDGIKIVRKQISVNADREYGYVRWYSQLKKLQRFSQIIPDLIPAVIDVGVTDNGVYFDIEYINALDIKTLFLTTSFSDEKIKEINASLWAAFDRLHQHTYKSNYSSLKLYFHEEVLRKINDARKFSEFENFYQIDNYNYLGKQVKGIKTILKSFKNFFDQPIDNECYIHGNPTLENILYSEDTGIKFIDLYEEGIVDSKFMDYSQVLQCSSSYYGMINDGKICINENVVGREVHIPPELNKFNSFFNAEIKNRFSTKEYDLIKLFEATQFFRMLPFKCYAGNIEAAKYFYVHACDLVNRLL
jgi:hypothetical protein